MRQLGRAFSIIVRQQVQEGIFHDDIAAYHAPSECHALVSKGECQRARMAKRHAKSVSGLSRAAFNAELRKAERMAVGPEGPRWMHRAASQLHERLNPFY